VGHPALHHSQQPRNDRELTQWLHPRRNNKHSKERLLWNRMDDRRRSYSLLASEMSDLGKRLGRETRVTGDGKCSREQVST
jgi:hypothetical protein